MTVTSSTLGQRNRGSERKRGLSKVTQEGDALGARAFWGGRWGWGVLGTLPSKCLPTVGAPLGGEEIRVQSGDPIPAEARPGEGRTHRRGGG